MEQSSSTPPDGNKEIAPPIPESVLKAGENSNATKKKDERYLMDFIRTLHRENSHFRYEVEQLKNDIEKLKHKNDIKVEFEERVESTKTLRTEIREQQEKMAEIDRMVTDLKRDLESDRAELRRAEEANKELHGEVEAVKEKIREVEGKLTIANNANSENEANIVALERQVGEADEAAKEEKKSYDLLEEKYIKAKDELEAAEKKSKSNQDIADSRARDNRGISDQLTEKTAELEAVTKQRDILQASEDTREQTEQELQDARDRIDALNDQIAKFQSDNERRPFDLDPTAYTIPNPASDVPVPENPSLNAELETLFAGDNSSLPRMSPTVSSEVASDDGDGYGSHSSVSAGDDDTLRIDQGEPEIRTVVQTEIREVVRTEVIFTPFEVSAHNPLLCWIQTELNYIILFSVWAQLLFSLASRLVRRSLGRSSRSEPTPTDDFHISTPVEAPVVVSVAAPVDDFDSSSPVGAPDTTQGDLQVDPVADLLARAQSDDKQLAEVARRLPDIEEKPDTREVIGDPVPPESPTRVEVRHMLFQTSGEPAVDPVTAAASTNPQDRTWYAKVVSPLPNEIPEIKKTLLGMVLHLIVYYGIFLCISCYYERKMWIAANDHTRAFVQQLLHHPRNQSLVQYLAQPLPEHWKRNIDIFVFKYFVETFGLDVNYAMPG